MIDPSVTLAIVWEPVRWVIPFLLIAAGARLALNNRLQGKAGELEVAKVIRAVTHHALHDVVLLNGRGGLTQIDHLVLTDAGIVVVETKALSGQIFARERERFWTQRLGRQKFRVRNPLRQNFGHVRAVQLLVGERIPVRGCVVMAGTAVFPNGMPEGVNSIAGFNEKLQPTACGSELPAQWIAVWKRLTEQVRCDAMARKAHRMMLEQQFGRDFRPAVGIGMIAVGLFLAGWFGLG